MTSLFDPIELRGLTARNRIWLSPMCQYSCFAGDGLPTDWHLVHLGARATGGFGLVVAEATAVSPEGRISLEDTGLWSDDHIEAWRRITDFVHSQGASTAVQLAHAGRKASVHSLFAEAEGSLALATGGWESLAPSPLKFGELTAPRELTGHEIPGVVADFALAAGRAETAGFDAVEIHAAHGYLLHQFLSPLANRRTDEYGGSFENRARIVVEVVEATRQIISESTALFVRLSGTDWAAGGWSPQDASRLGALLAEHGVDLIDVSSGGILPDAVIPVAPGYQVHLADSVRRLSRLAVGAVGLITEPAQAQQILDDGAADVVFVGRVALREPAWPLRAAYEFGLHRRDAPYAPQYFHGAWPRR
jgi:2,4-dienoyl-CoA reductase-like NADH-dependent reductase (Old Yellow Enzyme family)